MKFSLSILSLALLPALAFCTASKAPTPASVLEAFIAAGGGREAYEAVHSRISHGTCSLRGKEIEGTVTITEAEPGKNHVVMSMGDLGTLTQATDGESAWVIEPLRPPRLRAGEERERALRSATFHWFLKFDDLYESGTCTIDTLDGVRHHRLTMRPVSGDPDVLYFDAETNLLVRLDTTMAARGGSLPVETRYADYREVDGILVPHRMVQTMGDTVIEIVLDRVEHNRPIPDDLFALPKVLEDDSPD